MEKMVKGWGGWEVRNLGGLMDVVPHPNPEKYPNQSVYVLNINNYI